MNSSIYYPLNDHKACRDVLDIQLRQNFQYKTLNDLRHELSPEEVFPVNSQLYQNILENKTYQFQSASSLYNLNYFPFQTTSLKEKHWRYQREEI